MGGASQCPSDIRNRFGDRVADIVRSCSDTVVNSAAGHEKEDWHIRKTGYLEHLILVDPETLLISLSDKVHNARSILRDLRKSEIGIAVWDRFKKNQERYAVELPRTRVSIHSASGISGGGRSCASVARTSREALSLTAVGCKGAP